MGSDTICHLLKAHNSCSILKTSMSTTITPRIQLQGKQTVCSHVSYLYNNIMKNEKTLTITMTNKGTVPHSCSDVLPVLTNSQNKKIQKQEGVVSSANRMIISDLLW